MCISLTIYEILNNDVIWTFWEVFCCNGFNLHCKVEVWQVLEWNWWHSDLIFLCWNLDHWCIFINLEEFFQTHNFRHFTIDSNWKKERFCILELNFQKPTNFIILLYWRHFNSNFDLGSLFGSDLESDFLKIFISLIASHREDVFVKIIELLVSALGNDSKEERMIGWVLE